MRGEPPALLTQTTPDDTGVAGVAPAQRQRKTLLAMHAARSSDGLHWPPCLPLRLRGGPPLRPPCPGCRTRPKCCTACRSASVVASSSR